MVASIGGLKAPSVILSGFPWAIQLIYPDV